jgi:Polysaccharide biosynthesis enzyme WcbI
VKICVIANCQVRPIVKGLSALADVEKIAGLPIHMFGSPLFQKPQEEFRTLAESHDVTVLSFLLGDRFGEYETIRLKKAIPRLFTVTNLYFTGLHPDITYVGGQGWRLQSPLGDYHSKIILHSFVTSRSKSDCLERFAGKVYEKLGMFDEFEKSKNQLIGRDVGIDFPFGKIFLEMVKEHPSLYTVNHPTAFVFQEYIIHLAGLLGLRAHRMPLEILPNYLADTVWWPVYNEIGEYHSVQYSMPMVFKQPENLGGKFIDLEEFIDRSYLDYTRMEDRIRSSTQVQMIIEQWGA